MVVAASRRMGLEMPVWSLLPVLGGRIWSKIGRLSLRFSMCMVYHLIMGQIVRLAKCDRVKENDANVNITNIIHAGCNLGVASRCRDLSTAAAPHPCGPRTPSPMGS